MFSIHCKVLRVGRLEKEGILIQNRRQIKTRGGHQNSPAVPCMQSFKDQCKTKTRNQCSEVARLQDRVISPLIMRD